MNHPGYTITTYVHDRMAELEAQDAWYRDKVTAMTPTERVIERAQLIQDIDNTKYRPLGMSAEQEIRDIQRKMTILLAVK